LTRTIYLDIKLLALKILGLKGKEDIMATATMFIRHRVADYAAWRSVYDSVEDLRQQYGCFNAEVLIDPHDKQDLYVLHRFPSLDQAEAFAGSGELHEAMDRAGVTGPPRIEFAVEA
jgi:quinol monooxygenase YgiN